MGNFESFDSEIIVKPEDMYNLREHLRDSGVKNFDDTEQVLAVAKEYFSNYTETDVEAIVSELYKTE